MSPALAADGSVDVLVDVTNSGSLAGDEVVQLYVGHPKSRVERPREELKGFKRVAVSPGQTVTVQIPLKASTLAYWDEKQVKLVVEREPLALMVGSSSKDIKLTGSIDVR